MYHEVTNPERPFKGTWTRPNPSMNVYNNTFAHPQVGNPVFPRSYVTYEPSPYDRQRNNIYVSQIIANFGSDIANSVMPGTNPLFVGGSLSNPVAYFQLQAGSPARGIGVASFTGATGGTITANIDAGAYQYGDTNPWVPGYTPIPYEASGGSGGPVPQLTIDNVGAANIFVGSWQHFDNLSWTQSYINKTGSVATAPESTVTVAFNGIKVEWYSEKRENHAIVGISIDGGAETMLDLYEARTDNNSTLVFTASGLALANHTIRIRLTNTRNAASTGNPFAYSCVHDGIRVYTE